MKIKFVNLRLLKMSKENYFENYISFFSILIGQFKQSNILINYF